MKLRFLALIATFVLCQACSNGNTKVSKTEKVKEPAKVKTAKKVEKTKAKKESEEEHKAVEIKEGDSLTEIIAKIPVKDHKLKNQELKSYVSGKEVLITLVKPGCIFCETLMSVVNTTNPKIKPEFIIVMDGAHATEEEFKAKRKKHSNVKATWVYDYENHLHDDLGLDSFPRLLHLDKEQTLLKHQIGLVMPEDKTTLEGQPFPIILQRLSENTVNWMKTL